MDNLLFQDKNQSYTVKFDTKAYEQMLFIIVLFLILMKQGGILIGNYSSNQAIANILQITPPPQNSRHSKCTFHRGYRWIKKNFRFGMEPRSVLFRRVALSSKCIVGTK